MHVFDSLEKFNGSLQNSVIPTLLAESMLAIIAYVLVMGVVMKLQPARLKRILFAVLNLGVVSFFYRATHPGLRPIVYYILAVLGFYFLTRWLAFKQSWWIAALAPILLLVFSRYIPTHFSFAITTASWIGLSYMVFRLSQLVVVVRNKVTPMPDVFEFLGFAFFAPTLLVGPISSYSTFQASFLKPNLSLTPAPECWLRMLVGATKIWLFGTFFSRLGYQGLLLDGHNHPPIDLMVAAISYYLFMYCNFSGFCDVAIGSSGVLGIKVSENFDEPFIARNLKDFWNRWHITLSSFMRDMVFSPMSKTLLSKLPDDLSSHAIPITIGIVFLLIGLWHGQQWNFVAFGLMHAIGVAANYYYDLLLRQKLTKDQLRRYNHDPFVRFACIAITFVYVCASFFIFANSPENMQEILFHVIKW